MGLFDKKFCDVCGEKIGLLGNRKLEDGNLCKNCAKKLSPWFDERRHSTVEQIKKQLAYREQNRSAAAAFRPSRTFGKDSTKLYIDESARKFTVCRGTDFASDNPDILDFSQAAGCDLEIRENRSEIKKTVDGKSVSYNPPRYEYSYDFKVTVSVNHPYFNSMNFDLNSSRVHTGENRMTGGSTGAWRVSTTGSHANRRQIDEFNELVQAGNDLKATIDGWRGNTSAGFGASSSAGFGANSFGGFGGASQKEVFRFGSKTPVPYTENSNRGLVTCDIRFMGTAEVGVMNPAAVQSFGGLGALRETLTDEITAATTEALNRLSASGTGSVKLPSMSREIAEYVSSSLNQRWQAQYGAELSALSYVSFQKVPDSTRAYQQAQSDPSAQTAAPQSQSAGWTCSFCGASNAGKFCTSCGAKRGE